MNDEVRSFPAIYRGKVVDNKDPQERGRIKVRVPAVLQTHTDTWAMPAEPYAGSKVGFFAIPPVDADVWVQFENGDHTLPIWTGCYWTTKDDVPVSPGSPDIKVFRTEGIFVAHNSYSGDQTAKCGDVEIRKGFTVRVGSPIVQGYLQLFMGVDGVIEIDNNGEEIIRMKKENIQIIKEDQSIITMTKPDITIQTSPLKMEFLSQSNTISTTNQGSNIKMTTDGIKSTHGAGETNLSTGNIEIKFAAADIVLSASGINITFPPLASVSLSPAGTNVNSGALEVT
jgi:hypothetical protein